MGIAFGFGEQVLTVGSMMLGWLQTGSKSQQSCMLGLMGDKEGASGEEAMIQCCRSPDRHHLLKVGSNWMKSAD